MNILVTGSFGQIGSKVLESLSQTNYNIRCFDLKNKQTKKVARNYKNRFEIFWGDIRDKTRLAQVVVNQDLIIHLAFHLPPINEDNLSFAREVNITGMENLIELAKKQSVPPKIIFASSVSIYGDVRNKLQPISTNAEPNPVDYYAKHKVECMEILRKSGLTYSIFILGFIPPIDSLRIDPMMFEMPLDTNIELLHEKDVALAFENAISNDDIWNRTFHIAGGEKCRLKYSDFIDQSMNTMGLGSLPKEAFGGQNYHSCFMSSEKSQAILNYQYHSAQDILSDMKEANKTIIVLVKTFRPLIRRYLIKQSPYI